MSHWLAFAIKFWYFGRILNCHADLHGTDSNG